MNFKEQMDLRTQEVQCIIEKYLPEEEGFQKTLLEAVNYSMTAGGETFEATADAGDVPDVRRQHRGGGAFHGRDRDDTYPFSHPR